MKILIYARNKINVIVHTKWFERLSNEVKSSVDIEIIEEFLFDFHPDIFITHLHTFEGRQFKKIRNLTALIRQKTPKCLIVITLHNDAFWYKEYQDEYFNNYSYDLIGNESLTYLKLHKNSKSVHPSSYYEEAVYECILELAKEKTKFNNI
ncbi:hypothetical protein Q4Q35_13535 [Flavivirga aquimarina]|uniref:Uncharacterized protein n=1 Tax=Flavivirga aquimarina TaxID=2027862 RepID=A0ABT8WCJ0_9FLAO|nr:hypothetical protein [Flavivirga aquimarina]MDO5970831.1 hypothetical protein [Flavivirga aquimarina]